MKFDTGFNYYARFARLVRDRGGKEGEREREGGKRDISMLNLINWVTRGRNSRMIDRLF